MDMSNHRYNGEYTSAIARARRVLIAAGIPWSKTTGRYPNTRTTSGVRIQRVGCSNSITIHSWNETRDFYDPELEARALAILRENGMPFDDRGWLECRRRA